MRNFCIPRVWESSATQQWDQCPNNIPNFLKFFIVLFSSDPFHVRTIPNSGFVMWSGLEKKDESNKKGAAECSCFHYEEGPRSKKDKQISFSSGYCCCCWWRLEKSCTKPSRCAPSSRALTTQRRSWMSFCACVSRFFLRRLIQVSLRLH